MIAERPEKRLAALFEALADASRIELLMRMRAKGACIAGTLATSDLNPSIVSDQIQALRRVGLIQGVIDGPTPCFCINRDEFAKLRAFLDDFA